MLFVGQATDAAIARRVGIKHQTVAHWRERYVAAGVPGLSEAPMPGWLRTYDDKRVAELLNTVLHTQPKSRTHWSVRAAAKSAVVGRIYHVQINVHFLPPCWLQYIARRDVPKKLVFITKLNKPTFPRWSHFTGRQGRYARGAHLVQRPLRPMVKVVRRVGVITFGQTRKMGPRGGLMVGLGLLGRLERTLATTNPIEKLHGITRAMTGRVKRCRNGAMALCCVAAGLLARDSAASGATARCPG